MALACSSIGPDDRVVNQEWVDSTLRRRRLFAAARTEFIRPLLIGQRAQMTERVIGRVDKVGRSGPFQVLTVEYEYFQGWDSRQTDALAARVGVDCVPRRLECQCCPQLRCRCAQ